MDCQHHYIRKSLNSISIMVLNYNGLAINKSRCSLGLFFKNGGTETIRTSDLVIRNHSLYPAELRPRSAKLIITNKCAVKPYFSTSSTPETFLNSSRFSSFINICFSEVKYTVFCPSTFSAKSILDPETVRYF